MPGTRRAGGVTRRCECREGGRRTGKRLGDDCPQLTKRSHGAYMLAQELPPSAEGKRRQFRRTGYATSKEANADLSKVRAILDLADEHDDAEQERVGTFLANIARERAELPAPADVAQKLGVGVPLDGTMTIAQWLDKWLDNKKTRTTTTASYRSHCEYHLKPRIGHLRLDRLGVDHLEEMFAAIEEEAETIAAENAARREQEARCRWTKPGRPPAAERTRLAAERARLAEMKPYRKVTGTGTLHAIRRTLRTALNAAIGRKLITYNAARYVELTAHSRPKGLLWTDERVARWRATREIPSPVMVWTPRQLGQFLDAAEGHRLYAGYHLIGHHGLRRGECVGHGWDNTYLDAVPPRIEVLTEIVVDGWTPIETAPKTEGSMGAVTLDRGTVVVLREQKVRRLAERDAWNREAAQRRARGEDAHDWVDTGKILTAEDGSWLHPDVLSREFEKLCLLADVPPINLRDLRHVAAALVKAGGGDIDDAKTKLRHSTITLTSDTYMALFTEYEQELTERSAAAVPRARRAPEKAAEDEDREPDDTAA